MNLGLITATTMIIASSAIAQHSSHGSSNTETGQSQFAAIAEIVTMLRDDPKTDWEQVDIDALRAHLVDMDNVTTKAKVQTTVNGLVVTFAVTGDADVALSIQRMTSGHSPMLQRTVEWIVTTEELPDGALMMVEVAAVQALSEVTGLGFFGLMTIGAHHQQHHMMIAKGHSPH